MLNGTVNHTVYGNCDWVSSNLMIRKESWQTTVSIIIIVVSASRLFLEVLELFQVAIDLRFSFVIVSVKLSSSEWDRVFED